MQSKRIDGKPIASIDVFKEDGKLKRRFTTGPIKGTPYALTRTCTIVRTKPKPLDKKKRRKCLNAQRLQPGGVWIYCDRCKARTFHVLGHVLVTVEGYEEKQREETYECCLCDGSYTRTSVDAALAAAAQPTNDDAPGS